MKKGVLWLASLLLMGLAAPSLAQQEFRSNVTLTTTTGVAFTLSIANTSTAALPITGITFTLNSGTTFDTFGTASQAVTYNPNPGANNDGTQQQIVTVTPTSPLMPGQTLSFTGGDIDGATLTSIGITIAYGTTNVTRSLTVSGSVWSVQISVPAAPIPTGSMTLTWIPPTTNTDGSPYTNPAGYKVYYGTMQGTYANSRTINNPSATSYVLDQLPYATYYVVATAFNTNGTESVYSNSVQKAVDATPTSPLISLPVMTGGVTTEPDVYTLVQSRDNGVMFPFGTAPLGTPCNGKIGFLDEQRGAMYVIPKSAVTFEPGADAELLFAKCAN